MPKHIGNLLDRTAAADQSTGQRVTQRMATARDAGTSQGTPDCTAHPVDADGLVVWRQPTDEQGRQRCCSVVDRSLEVRRPSDKLWTKCGVSRCTRILAARFRSPVSAVLNRVISSRDGMIKSFSLLALAAASSTAWAGITVNGSTPETAIWNGATYYKLPLVGHNPSGPTGPRGKLPDDLFTTQAVGDQGACTPDEFVTMSTSLPAGASLINRHKFCQRYRSTPTLLSVDLMQRTPGGNWEYYRPGVQYYDVKTVDVGTIVIETSFQAYGASTVLAKTFKVDASALSFSFAPGFPAYLQSSLSLTLTPVPMALIDAGGSIQNLDIRLAGAINPITLSASAPSGSTGAFGVTFTWSFTGSDPAENYFNIRALVPKYTYAVNNTPRASATEPFPFDASSSAGYPDAPYLRCDSRVASTSLGFEKGCVFHEAAAIMEISKSGAGAEAAAHIEAAQTTRDAIYKTHWSPGVFVAKLGTRAIPEETVEQTLGLIRGTSPDDDINRRAACDNTYSGSLVRTRPFSGSPTCQPPQPSTNCSCDEYPFAMTKNGGAYNPDGTSVRYVQKSHNSSSSGLLTATHNSQRVFRGEKFWVRVVP